MDSIQNAISESSHPGTGRRSISLKGKIILGITGGIGIGLTVVCLPFVSPALRKHCLPYVPATTQQVKNVLYAVQKENPSSRNVRLLDIGSGDGRIVIESAKQGHTSHGVELNPWLVYYSRLNAYRMGVWNKTKFYRKNLWNFNVSGYNNIVIFGVDGMVSEKLEATVWIPDVT